MRPPTNLAGMVPVDPARARGWAWLTVALWCLIIVVWGALSGCASLEDRYCADGRALRKVGDSYACHGFGSGFGYSVVPVVRSPWWAS